MLFLDLKSDMPSVDEARRRFAAEMKRKRGKGGRLLKILHGYGSTGQGGAINEALRKSIRMRKKEGKVTTWIIGEEFYATDPSTLALLQKYPELAADSDYGRGNPGITIVELA